MSAVMSPVFGAGFQGFTNQGVVLSGGLIYTYLAGTTTPVATWTSSSQSVSNPNPIVLNSAGRPPQEVWILNGQAYKFVLTDSNNNVLGTWDNVPGINASNAILSEWVVGVTASYVSSTSFTVSGNLANVYQPNRRIQYTLTGGTYYGSITTSVYNGSSLTTIVFVPDSTGLDSSVTVVNYGFMSASPTSIPQVFASNTLSNTWTGATNDFTGSNPLVPTATAGDSSTKAASTAFAMTMTSPGFLGNPTAPTQTTGNSSTRLATTAFVNQTAFNSALPAQSGATVGQVPISNGTNAAWGSVSITPLGEQNQTSGTNITLTNASVQTQNITMSAAGLAVVMGVGTTYNGVGVCQLIRNSGVNNFDLQDSTGQCIFAGLTPGSSVIVWLRDNTTAAGLWSLVGNQAVQTPLVAGLASVFQSASVVNTAMCPLNSTQALVISYDSSYLQYFTVLTLSGTTLTANTPQKSWGNGATSATPYAISCCSVGNNQAVVVDGMARVYCVNVSGTGAGAALNGGVNNFAASVPFAQPCEAVSVAPAGAGTVIVTYQITATHAINACVVTYDANNNVCVAGQGNSMAVSVVNGSVNLCNIGADSILCTYQTSTSVYGYVLTGVSGIYSKGATYTLVNAQANASYPVQVCSIGGNQAMLVYSDTAVTNYCTGVVISISGSVLSVNTKQAIVSTNPSYPLALCQLTTAAALVLTYNGSTYQLYAMTVSGTTITVGTPVTATAVASTAVGANALCQTNTNKAVLVYWDGSANVYSRVVSVSGTTITYNTASSAISSNVNPQLSICQTNTDQACFALLTATTTGKVYSANTASTTAVNTGTSFGSTPYNFGIAPTAATGAGVITVYQTDANQIRAYGFTVASGSSAPSVGSVNNTDWPLGLPAQTSTGAFAAAYSSSGKAIFAPGDGTYSNNYYTFLVQASGTTVTTPTIGYSVATGYTATPGLSSAAMGTNTALLAYTVTSTGYLNAVVATATGYALALGTPLLVSGSFAFPSFDVVYLSSNTWLITFSGTAGNCYAEIMTASGTTLSLGGYISFGTAVNASGSLSVTAISASQALVSYKVSATSVNGQLVNISGTTPSASGSPITLDAAGETFLSSCLVGTNVVRAYAAYLTPYYGYGQVVQYVKV